jgi:hypothetical protein
MNPSARIAQRRAGEAFMIRPLVATSALALIAAFETPTLAAPSQDIAYVKVAGTANELYVANHDGTGLMKVYATAKKHGITALDFSPAGNELVFVERVSGSPSVLKRLRLKDTGAADGAPVTVPNVCAPNHSDYNPADPTLLLVSGVCNGQLYIATVRTDGSAFSMLQQGNANLYIDEPRWLHDGASYIYVRSIVPGTQELCRNACDESAGDLLGSDSQIVWNDVARTSDIVIYTDNVGKTKLIDVAARSDITPTPFVSGRDGHYSPGDDAILYRSSHQASGDYVLIYDVSTGLSSRVTGKGDWGPVDWRP